jgi:ABC-2 type transport system permease protein
MEIQGLLMVTAPVITAVALFKYLNSQKLGDLIHSLPIKRENIYNNYIVIGIISLIIPLIINGIICIMLNLTLDLSKYYTIKDVFVWMSLSAIIEIVVFLISVFVAMTTGISIAQGILTYIVLFLPIGLFGLLVYNIQLFIYGFSPDYYFQQKLEMLTPITRAFTFADKRYPMSLTEILVYILIFAVLYFVSKRLYKIRKIEAYSNAVVFPVLRPIFKYGITFGTMLVGGVYFGNVQESAKWALFGYFVGSLIGYFVAEIILRKSIYVFNNIKGYLIYSLAIILILIGCNMDIIGYQKYVPTLEEVKSVYFSEGAYYEGENGINSFYFDESNINDIQILHNKIIRDKDNNIKSNMENREDIKYMTFMYELKNGKKVVRSYTVSYKNYYKYLKPIYESDEYKKINYEILRTDYNNMNKVVVTSILDPSKKITLIDNNEIKDAVKNLKEDINNESYSEMIDNKDPWADVLILLPNGKEVYSSWDKTYVNFEKWLDKKGYTDTIKVSQDEVSYIIVEKRSSKDVYSIEENNSADTLKITDKKQINTCLNEYTQSIFEQSDYIIEIHLENGVNAIATFDNNNVPGFVVNHFNK